jgi:hypothetical protein
MKCQSRLIKSYKRAKADSQPVPSEDVIELHLKNCFQGAHATSCKYKSAVGGYICPANPAYRFLPICDGALSVKISAAGGGGCSCCAEPVRLVIAASCTKCKGGWHPKIQALMDRVTGYSDDILDITDLLDKETEVAKEPTE